MAFCSKCGAEVADGTQFCPACGEALAGSGPAPGGPAPGGPAPAQGAPNQQYQAPPPVANYANLEQDADANKAFGILAYIGILVLITIFAAPKQSLYSRYHANQGLVLCLFGIAMSIVVGVVQTIISAVVFNPFAWKAIAVVTTIFTLVWVAVSVIFLILAIMGIINAAGGKCKPLPIIGKIKILK